VGIGRNTDPCPVSSWPTEARANAPSTSANGHGVAAKALYQKLTFHVNDLFPDPGKLSRPFRFIVPRARVTAHGLRARLLRLKATEQRRRQRRTERQRAERAAMLALKHAPRLELLGSAPPVQWLARIGIGQARLRSATAYIDNALLALQTAVKHGVVGRRDASLVHAQIHACKALLEALQPITICPHCRASDPACQACSGRGVLTLQQASQCEPALLHD